ncbi:hypothetical protein KOW79_020248 [Hemibagrus wyckioides]|uniref:Uncharacterized protein n=1 Tax=Hemibagrus wyckioides TaxID=337641 RepID=A0A9D3N6Q7_9TELE|nr:hypothetical protein KOW79_020248 [Hemibagrus wyckioides]
MLLTGWEVLIHSNNMETSVFIHDCQNLAEASKGTKESRHFQRSSRCLLLILFTLLGLLVVGLVVLFTVWVAQNVVKSDFTCPQVNFGPGWTFNISGPGDSHIFTALNNGTYFIYGKFQINKQKTEDCEDIIKLAWSGPAKSDKMSELTKTKFKLNNDIYMAEIKEENVKLSGKSKVHLIINCNQNIRANFRVGYRSE